MVWKWAEESKQLSPADECVGRCTGGKPAGSSHTHVHTNIKYHLQGSELSFLYSGVKWIFHLYLCQRVCVHARMCGCVQFLICRQLCMCVCVCTLILREQKQWQPNSFV